MPRRYGAHNLGPAGGSPGHSDAAQRAFRANLDDSSLNPGLWGLTPWTKPPSLAYVHAYIGPLYLFIDKGLRFKAVRNVSRL